MINFEEEYHKLNENQRQVVEEIDRNIILMATAGTGKTNSLALRIVKIIRENRARGEEILCLTFTNRGAREMKERILSMVGEEGTGIIIKTFHSFCFDIIKEDGKKNSDIPKDFVIYDEEDCLEIIRELKLPERVSTKGLFNFINFIKEERMGFEDDSYGDIVQRALIYKYKKVESLFKIKNQIDYDGLKFIEKYGTYLLKLYDGILHQRHGVDFNDLLLQAKKIFSDENIVKKYKKKFKYIHIDEVQDTSLVEYGIIRNLIGDNNIMICGDYFQTIYGWRGSKPRDILGIYNKEYNPVTIILDKNYRATKTLIEASYGFLKTSFNDEVKNIYSSDIKASSKEIGDKIVLKGCDDIKKEAEWIFKEIKSLNLREKELSKVAVLTRNNKTNIEISEEFARINSRLSREDQIKFLLIEEFKFFRKTEIKDILVYLKVLINKWDSNSLTRIFEKFAKGIGKVTIDKIKTKDYREAGIRLSDFIDNNTYLYGDPYQRLYKELDKDNIVVFDVESTGIDTSSDEIIQIAAIRINNKGEIIDKFERFIKPKKSVGSSAAVHGFTDEILRESGEKAEVVFRDFSKFIEGRVIVGHNVSYDITILNSNIHRTHMEIPKFLDYFDTLDIARRFYPRLKNHKLDTLSEEFKTKTKSSHNAMNDILATKDVLLTMLEKKIIPNSMERLKIYGNFTQKFKDIHREFNEFRDKCGELLPTDIIKEVVEFSSIKEVYKNHHGKLENIKEFYKIVKEFQEKILKENPEMSNYDVLVEVLKHVALSASEMDRILEKNPKIPIITVHQSKGAEFNYVFLIGLEEGEFPSYSAIKEEKESQNSKEEEEHNIMREEKRVFYVAITRAKKKLYLSYVKERYGYPKYISRFVEDIPKNYIQEL